MHHWPVSVRNAVKMRLFLFSHQHYGPPPLIGEMHLEIIQSSHNSTLLKWQQITKYISSRGPTYISFFWNKVLYSNFRNYATPQFLPKIRNVYFRQDFLLILS